MSKGKEAKTKRREIVAPVSELLSKPFLNEFEVSAITGRAVNTLRNERHLRRGIPYLKVSKRTIRYKIADVFEFMERQRVTFNEVSA